LSLEFHVLEISWRKLLKLDELFLVDDLNDQSFIVRFREGRVALTSRAIPVLAAIEASDINSEIDSFADP
jgi:hypothetical protein